MDKAQMLIVVLRILLEKLATAESRSDVVNALKAMPEAFVEQVPVHAKKQTAQDEPSDGIGPPWRPSNTPSEFDG